MVADIRDCEQCGTSFVPRREHARFCSARCRAAWNREHMGDPAAGASALVWSITAMSETTQMTVMMMMKFEPNQSSRWPLSRTTCIAPSPRASRPRPM